VQRALDEELRSEDEARRIATQAVAEDAADYDIAATLEALEREMLEAAGALEFERAAALRDEIRELRRATTPAPAKGDRHAAAQRRGGSSSRQWQ
jgi:excinuclease ABC subunit B